MGTFNLLVEKSSASIPFRRFGAVHARIKKGVARRSDYTRNKKLVPVLIGAIFKMGF